MFAFKLTSPKTPRVFRRSLLHWYGRHGRDLPWRKTRDPYAIRVSESMLQQTQVSTAYPLLQRVAPPFPRFCLTARASENDVLRARQALGYYARARLFRLPRALSRSFRGRFPLSLEQMQQLRGIGKCTAHAVASLRSINQSHPRKLIRLVF